MTIAEISSLNLADGFAPVEPFVFQLLPGGLQLASFWTSTFSAPDESRDFTITVRSFIRAFNQKYNETISYNDCVAQEGSFYWDNINQVLYVHFEHDQEGWTDTYQYGTFFGFSDNRLVCVEDQEYLPLIASAPSIAQQQDIVNYDRLSFINGSIVLNNRNNHTLQGQLDYFIGADLYNNDVFLYYLDDSISDPMRSDLVPLAAFYVEDYDISLKEIKVRVQDQRKAQNITIPTAKFLTSDYADIGDYARDVIPLMYGEVREAKATPTNSDTTSGTVDYRVALTLTTLGTVQVDIDGIWTTKTPTATTLSTGEFTLAEADGRDTNGKVRDCRVLLPEGISITYLSDIIIDLNERYLGIEYLSSNYDTTEWEAEETSLATGGWVYDSEIKLFEAIRLVQSGANVGFRYEILPDGRRTIRVDDPARTSSGRVEPVDIYNRDEMPVSTDSDQVFSSVEIAYNKSFNSGRYQREPNSDYGDEVLARYKQQNTLPVDTMLNDQTDAETAAADKAERFKEIPQIMELVLMGADFLPLRIFDVLDVEATPDFADADNSLIVGREYFGFKTGKIVGVSPDLKKGTNKVRFQLGDA